MKVCDRLKNKKMLIMLSLIIILGFSLRLYNLDSTSLWEDELKTVYRISLPVNRIMIYTSYYQSIYFVMLKLWAKIFGNSEFSLRFPSLIFSVLSIIFVFKLSKELFNEKVAFTAALLLSVSPYNINYAQEAKMYSMLWFFGILSFLFFYKFIKNNKTSDLLLYIVSVAASIYTLYIGFLFIVVQNIFFFSFLKAKEIKRWLGGQLIVFLLYLTALNKFLRDTSIIKDMLRWVTKTDNHFRFLLETFLSTTGVSIGTENLAIHSIEFCLYLFLITSAVIYLKNARHKKQIFDFTKEHYLLFAWIIIPIIIYFLIDIFYAPALVIRYMGFIHIPLIILFSKGLNKYNIRVSFTILVLLLTMTFTNHLYPYYKYGLRINKQDWRGLFDRIHEKADENSLIINFVVFLPTDVINYYNKGYKMKKIRSCNELGEDINDEKYDSFFLIYRSGGKFKKAEIEKIESKGYKLKEHYFKTDYSTIGYLWFVRDG